LAASVRPVIVLVRPGPWWTEQAATWPLTRPKASAIVIAPPSCREAAKDAPASTIATVMSKFPLPITPKTWRTPAVWSRSPMVRATLVIGANDDGPR